MPRNSQGLYTLPAGNPVVPNTLIESNWANPTMDDIAVALTGSLPRDGSAPMVGPLTLSSTPITAARQATTKAYVDQFLAFGSGLPIGAVVAYAGAAVPPGYLECNGQAVSRTTYSALFTAIGTIYGSGDGSTTFNVPDMRDEFIRGKSDTRPLGNKQGATFASHIHTLSDPGHGHTQAAHDHVITTGPHTHSIIDPGHVHQYGALNNSGGAGVWGTIGAGTQYNTTRNGTGIGIDTAGNLGGSADVRTPIIASAVTGLTIGTAGGDETRPQNIAQIYIIKAVDDAVGPVSLTGITTSDAQMISVDNTLPNAPDLVIHSNVAFGTVKLDASGQIPLGLLPSSSQNLLGYWNASGGQTPSQASPSTNFASGDTFIISVTGLLTVFDPVTLVASPTTVAVGSLLQYIENSLTNPTGWYYVVGSTTVVASQVGFTPAGTIAATNVQSALVEVDGDVVANTGAIASLQTADASNVKKTSNTGAAHIPAGATAQRPPAPQFGDQRANSDETAMEWWNGTAWSPMGGGATGAPNNPFIYENDIHVTANYTITTGKNGMSAGPITVDDGVTVIVPNGSTWSVV